MGAHSQIEASESRLVAAETADALFLALTQASDFAVAVVDRDRRIRFANELFASMVQRPVRAVLGLRFDELFPLAGPETDSIIARVLQSGEAALKCGFTTDWGRIDFDVIPAHGASGVERVIVVVPLGDLGGSTPRGNMLRDRQTILETSTRLARMTLEDADTLLDEALAGIAREYGADRAYVRLASEDKARFEVAYHYDAPGMPPLKPETGDDDLRVHAPLVERYRRGETVVVESIDQLAADDPVRVALERVGCRSVCAVPIGDGEELIGRLAFVTVDDHAWPELSTQRIRFFGEMFGGALRRLRAERALRERLRVEQTMATTFARLVDARAADVDAELERALREMAQALHMDRTVIGLLDDARERFVITHEWSAPGLPSFRASVSRMAIAQFGWPLEHVLRGETVNMARSEVPESATNAKAVLDRAGVRAMALLPLSANGTILGHLAFQSVRRAERLPDDVMARLHLVAGAVASALARARAEASLFESESRFTQIIETALDGVVVLDDGGVVVEWTPQSERLFGRQRHEVVGRRFADVALDAKDRDRFPPSEASGRFELTGWHREKRAFPIELSITRMKRGARSILAVFVRDISDRKRAEQERQRAFDEVARQKATAERERDYLREELGTDVGDGAILGASPALRRALESVDAVAATGAAVLIHGESGVGKELFARAIHARSKRAAAPLVKVNCASIPESLFESEFFGHVRGSFTGAHKDRVGRFELSDGGTLFLDEVGEIPLDMQAKLLRVLQEGEFERVGDDRTRKVDVRIVAATNRDLGAEVQAGRFRRDLYYRLSVFPIEIPPLRDRPEDIVPLAKAFLRSMARNAGRPGLELTASQEGMLVDYEWPGNIRELQHVIERAVILSPSAPLRLDRALAPSTSSMHLPAAKPRVEAILTDDELRKLERDNLVAALEKANGRVSGEGGAAELLGMNPSTLRDRMKALGLARRG